MVTQTFYKQNQHDYIREYQSNIEEVLQATLTRETRLPNQVICRSCHIETIATWRCTDCVLPDTLCRCCMRNGHMRNPLHRIEHWTGTHFRRAELWEVGVYLRLTHQNEVEPCSRLDKQIEVLHTFENERDILEQDSLSGAGHDTASDDAAGLFAADGRPNPFLHARPRTKGKVPDDDFDDDELSENDAFNDYDPPNAAHVPDDMPPTPRTDAFNNSYVRVVHTNGIHHLAMVACPCRGDRQIAFDLIASAFMPASFTRIRTVFSCQLLDHFRLCNLELKASAYQYYNMIRRLTSSTAPADVLNVTHEFRRMVRIWRWIKKLKWAGYGHNKLDPTTPPKGALANFCPACPQAGINLPKDWKDDPNRFYANAECPYRC
jgi:hypothetical protein